MRDSVNWTTVKYQGKEYRVPVTGPDENLNAMLTEIPGQREGTHGWHRFNDWCMAFLMQDGNLYVPGGRYGSYTRSCAPFAILMARIMQHNNGEAITYYQLDSDMGLVVNSHDDVAHMIFEYGELVSGDGFDIADWLNEADIEECERQHAAEWGQQ